MSATSQTGAAAPRFRNLLPGDPAPWFIAASGSRPDFAFDTVAGRYIVLCFLGTARDPAAASVLAAVAADPVFDDLHASFFGVSLDPDDRAQGRMQERVPGIRHFWDHDGAVARAYGAVAADGPAVAGGQASVRRIWVVLDPTLRVLHVAPFGVDDPGTAAVLALLRALPPPGRHVGFAVQAPVLVLPRVLEVEVCAELIATYEREGGEETGAMVERDGKTVAVLDPAHKRRRDVILTDSGLIGRVHQRIKRRVVPEIAKAHQFHATRIERALIGCYTAEDGGHFRAHRDNTTKGTAHRRFAVSINLNDDFDGGEVWFPEYGPQGFRMPPGGAVVFSCSLLHAVRRVTRGRRYAFLPFLYDDAAAALRLANNPHLDPTVGSYKGG